VCDTRLGELDAGGCVKGAVFGGAFKDVTIAGVCGIPAGASAVSINITAVPVGLSPGDLRVAPNPPGALPLASVVNYQNGDTVANAADVPIGTGVRIFVDGQGTNFVVDVMGYFKDVSCQAGTVKALGQCFEVSLRAPLSIFDASDTCRAAGLPGGGRLATGLELRSLRNGNPLTLAPAFSAPPGNGGEWVDSVFTINLTDFRALTIANDGGFDSRITTNPLRYRCVFRPLP
jgi:hypothetical protein